MARGVVVYRGAIKDLVKEMAKNDDGSFVVDVRSITIVKDAFFYKNFFGRLIYLDKDVVFHTYNEADYYTNEVLRLNPIINQVSCRYVDDVQEEVMITRRQFRLFKKRIRDNTF